VYAPPPAHPSSPPTLTSSAGTDCALGQALCYTAITVCLRHSSSPDAEPSPSRRQAYAEASIAFFFLYYVFFGIGWQGVPWLYPTEINGLSTRTKGAALATATNWIVNFMVVEVTPPGIAALGWRFYIIWTVLNFAFVPVVYLFYPETADRSLEDVDRFFSENHDVVVCRDRDATCSRRPRRYVEDEREEVRRHSSLWLPLQAQGQGGGGGAGAGLSARTTRTGRGVGEAF